MGRVYFALPLGKAIRTATARPLNTIKLYLSGRGVEVKTRAGGLKMFY